MRELMLLLMSMYGFTGEIHEMQKGYTTPSRHLTHPVIRAEEAHTQSASGDEGHGVGDDRFRCPCGSCNCVSGNSGIILADQT